MTKTCLLCACWSHEGEIKGVLRHGGKCLMTDKDSGMTDNCWAWKICSPNQMDKRKEAGLIEDVQE